MRNENSHCVVHPAGETVVGAVAYGRRTSRGATLAEWAVGGRSLGTLIFWFMNAGEVYTTFAVLGISGYAWALGAPAYLAFCSVSMSYAVGYWLMPRIWKAGRLGKLVTQADFFAARFDAPWLGVITGVIGIASLIVYVQIQLVSLGLIVQLTLDDAISSHAATIVAGLLMIAFVFVAGIRSAAFAAGVKDVLMIVVVVLLSATVAAKVGAGSRCSISSAWLKPGIRASASSRDSTPPRPPPLIWLMTSAINIALGNWVFPHLFQMSYSARSATSIRTQCHLATALYSLAYFFIILLGFAALLANTHPPGDNLNAALLQFVSERYPSWVIGLVAGTGFLLALAPGALPDGRRRFDLHAQCRAAVRSASERRSIAGVIARLARVFCGRGRVLVTRSEGVAGQDSPRCVLGYRHARSWCVSRFSLETHECNRRSGRHAGRLHCVARAVFRALLGHALAAMGTRPDRDGNQRRRHHSLSALVTPAPVSGAAVGIGLLDSTWRRRQLRAPATSSARETRSITTPARTLLRLIRVCPGRHRSMANATPLHP